MRGRWAGGLSRRAACALAGYLPNGRVDRRADVIARTAELRVQADGLSKADLKQTVRAMLDLATSGDQTSAAARREARAARLEAYRLNGLLTQQLQDQSWTLPRELTEEEWEAKYGPAAPTPT